MRDAYLLEIDERGRYRWRVSSGCTHTSLAENSVLGSGPSVHPSSQPAVSIEPGGGSRSCSWRRPRSRGCSRSRSSGASPAWPGSWQEHGGPAARWFSGRVEDARKGDLTDRKALMRFNRLLRMQERQSGALIGLATRMRLTNQSRYTAQSAASRAKGGTSAKKLWES